MRLLGGFDNGLTEKRTDIGDCRVTFATEDTVKIIEGQDSWEIQGSLFSNIVDLLRRRAVTVRLKEKERKPKLNHR